MKYTLLPILAVLVLFLSSCGDQCPDSDTILRKSLPHVEQSKLAYQVDTLRFASENGEFLTFVKQIEQDNKIVRKKHRTIVCGENDEKFVDIYFEREESLYLYKGKGQDYILIRYFPTVSTLLREYNPVQIDNLNPIYRKKVTIKVPTYLADIKLGAMAMWEDQGSIDFFDKPLEEPLSFAGVTYDSVSYWSETVFGPPQYLYIDDYEMVGFVDSREVKWIRY